MRNFWALLFCCAFLPLTALAQNTAQFGETAPNKAAAIAAPVEIAFSYSYLRANQGPGRCGCFAMNGGSAEVAFHAYRWFSGVADLTGERSGGVSGGSQELSLVSFTAGPRFTYPIHHRYALFVQTLAGGVHGFDTHFPVSPGSSAANSFALLTGGGLDLRVKSYLAIRPIQADYFLTRLPNGVNNRQNSLRLSAGVVLRLW